MPIFELILSIILKKKVVFISNVQEILYTTPFIEIQYLTYLKNIKKHDTVSIIEVSLNMIENICDIARYINHNQVFVVQNRY